MGDIDKAKILYESGWSLREIGEQLKVSHDTVWKKLLIKGIRMRSVARRSKLLPGNVEDILKEYKGGMRATEIAVKYGLSHVYVYKILKNNKIKCDKRVRIPKLKENPMKDYIAKLSKRSLLKKRINEKWNISSYEELIFREDGE